MSSVSREYHHSFHTSPPNDPRTNSNLVQSNNRPQLPKIFRFAVAKKIKAGAQTRSHFVGPAKLDGNILEIPVIGRNRLSVRCECRGSKSVEDESAIGPECTCGRFLNWQNPACRWSARDSTHIGRDP